MKITELKPLEKNPFKSKGDEQIQKIAKSIQDFERMLTIRRIVIDENNSILGGNKRFYALKKLGYKEIPDEWVERVEDLTEDEKREFIVKDNSHWGSEWDYELLTEWNVDLEDWGVDLPDFEEEEEKPEAVEDDYEIPDEIQTDIVLGDLFEIGEHRLLCGDSTDSDSVAKLMNGEKAELLFTSPPYSDMREYNGNKDLSVDNLIEFIPTYLPYAEYQVINLGIQRKDNEIVQYWDNYIQKAKECGYKFLSWNVWVKPNASSIGNQTAMFPINHEWIFVFGENRKDLNRTVKTKTGGKVKQNYIRNADGSKESVGTHVRNMFTYLPTAIQLTQEGNPFMDHPAAYPVELPSKYITAITRETELVCDPFLGSGTTMVAGHQLKRKVYGMELDPKYAEVIVKRMIKLDNTLTIKRNGIDETQKWL